MRVLTKQDNMKLPASKKLTIGLIVVGLIWMVIGAFLNLMLSVTGILASFVMLFDLGFGGIVLWLIDEKEKSNKLVKTWVLIIFLIMWVALVMTAPAKPIFIIV